MKYFITSDIHSFYSQLKLSLDKCNFDINNPEHTLIVIGDVFDRGTETLEVYNFLKSIPKERCILIRGNHEELYLKLLNKKYPESHDFSNGTVLTFCQIAGYEADTAYDLRTGAYISYGTYWDNEYIDPECENIWRDIKKKVKESEVTKWLQSDQWVNYYELDKYIFVHSFIPLIFEGDRGMDESYCIYYGWTQYFKFKENWRNSNDLEWLDATWGCPYKFFDAGLFDPEKDQGKVLVCGHYRCSEFNQHYLNLETHDIYYGKNLIAIDATTALSQQVNVLVIDGDKCYDQNGLLKYRKPCPIIETVTLDKDEYEKYVNDVTNS